MPRRPLRGDPWVSCDNACHRARRPPSGGTDYAVPVGTDVIAPVSGFYFYNDNAFAGWGLRVQYNDRTIYLSHLSRRVGHSGRWFNEGDHVAESGGRAGAPGSGSSNGPHLHAEVVVAGTREGMEEWLRAVNGPGWAGGGVIPIDPIIPEAPAIPEEEKEMSYWLKHADHDLWLLIAPGVETVRIRDKDQAALISQAINDGKAAPVRTSAQLAATIAACEASLPKFVNYTPAQIALAVDAELEDEFRSLPDQVADRFSERL